MWIHMLLLDIMRMKIRGIWDFILYFELVFLEMLLNCYFIILLLFSYLISHFGHNNALLLFIYFSLFNIIIFFRLNYFIY